MKRAFFLKHVCCHDIILLQETHSDLEELRLWLKFCLKDFFLLADKGRHTGGVAVLLRKVRFENAIITKKDCVFGRIQKVVAEGNGKVLKVWNCHNFRIEHDEMARVAKEIIDDEV